MVAIKSIVDIVQVMIAAADRCSWLLILLQGPRLNRHSHSQC